MGRNVGVPKRNLGSITIAIKLNKTSEYTPLLDTLWIIETNDVTSQDFLEKLESSGVKRVDAYGEYSVCSPGPFTTPLEGTASTVSFSLPFSRTERKPSRVKLIINLVNDQNAAGVWGCTFVIGVVRSKCCICGLALDFMYVDRSSGGRIRDEERRMRI